MSNIINRPHLIFLLSIPITILVGFLNGNEMLDINVRDTYFIFSKTDLSIAISILFLTIGLGYYMMSKTNRRLSRSLYLIHLTLTYGGILLLAVLAQFLRESRTAYDFNNNLTSAMYLIALVAIIGQIVFPINMIYGLINKTKNSG